MNRQPIQLILIVLMFTGVLIGFITENMNYLSITLASIIIFSLVELWAGEGDKR